ncbi:MAG: hypothetical protein ACRDNK_07655 [Solirubrobacteraceae bacterium]
MSAERPGWELDAIAVLARAAGAVGRYGDPDQLACTIRRTAAGEYDLPTVETEAIEEVDRPRRGARPADRDDAAGAGFDG